MRRALYIAAAAVVLAQGSAAVASDDVTKPAFVPMEEIVVPIIDGPRASGRLRVKIVILARDPAAIPSIQARMPELRETALIATAEFARLYASPFAPVDAERLARGLSTALTAQDQHHAIARVLLVSIFAGRG